jgi:hypothetical protein
MSVYVGLGNLVKINQCKVSCAASGQHLCGPGPDSSQPENSYMCLLKLPERVFTYHLYDSGKSFHMVILIIPKVIINIKNIYK